MLSSLHPMVHSVQASTLKIYIMLFLLLLLNLGFVIYNLLDEYLRKGDNKSKATLYDIADDISTDRGNNYTLNHLVGESQNL